jgi:hypothetical protein
LPPCEGIFVDVENPGESVSVFKVVEDRKEFPDALCCIHSPPCPLSRFNAPG